MCERVWSNLHLHSFWKRKWGSRFIRCACVILTSASCVFKSSLKYCPKAVHAESARCSQSYWSLCIFLCSLSFFFFSISWSLLSLFSVNFVTNWRSFVGDSRTFWGAQHLSFASFCVDTWFDKESERVIQIFTNVPIQLIIITHKSRLLQHCISFNIFIVVLRYGTNVGRAEESRCKNVHEKILRWAGFWKQPSNNYSWSSRCGKYALENCLLTSGFDYLELSLNYREPFNWFLKK